MEHAADKLGSVDMGTKGILLSTGYVLSTVSVPSYGTIHQKVCENGTKRYIYLGLGKAYGGCIL